LIETRVLTRNPAAPPCFDGSTECEATTFGRRQVLWSGVQPERAKRDAELSFHIRRIFAENFSVYGVRKVWRMAAHLSIRIASGKLGAVQIVGRIFARPVLGVLHHQYVRI